MGTAEPDVPGVIKFSFDKITPLSPPPNPTSIIQAGQPISFQLDLDLEFFLANLLLGQQFSVVFILEREEDGKRKKLTAGPFTVPTSLYPVSTNKTFSVTAGPFTSGNEGTGADFEVAPGEDTGTFETNINIRFDNQFVRPYVSGRDQVYIEVNKT
jgi:hypothetical protein